MGNGWYRNGRWCCLQVLGQCVVGATIVSGLAGWRWGTNGKFGGGGWCAICFFIWLLMGIGFLACAAISVHRCARLTAELHRRLGAE